MDSNTCLEKLGHFRGALVYRTTKGCWEELSVTPLRYLGEASLLRVAGTMGPFAPNKTPALIPHVSYLHHYHCYLRSTRKGLRSS